MEKKGRYGEFGGQYAAETLMNALINLEEAFNKYKDDEDFNRELNYYHKQYTGRPSILYYAEKMTKDLGGAKIYLKREDLNHTGAHKINNVIGQCLLAKRMGKKKVIAETGAGQHGVATATFAAVLGLECDVYMGEEDTKRQALNVFRMNLLGATVHPITSGTGTLKDATNEAMRAWTANAEDTFYVLGSAVGPHPYPLIVKHFQSVISKETRKQLLETEGKLPDAVMACVGGGSNAIGMFADFIDEPSVKLYGAEAATDGVEGVKKFVLDTVEQAGANPCPPIVLGIGIGGSFDHCAALAKKALLRPLDEPNADPYYAALEKELLDAINATGFGPQGFGGATTCLGVAIEQKPTHVACLPVAVNISCHVTRRASRTL